nr:hypothetical protein [Bacillus sp. J33]
MEIHKDVVKEQKTVNVPVEHKRYMQKEEK